MVFLNLDKIAIGDGVIFCFVLCTGLKWGYLLGGAGGQEGRHSMWELMVGISVPDKPQKVENFHFT